MLDPIFFRIILIGACGYALAAGRWDAKIVAVLCIAATLATKLVISPLASRYSGMEIGVMVVDLLAFAGFTLVALKSDRFWPLWISGIQLTTSLAHVLKAFDSELMPQAYAAAGRFWVYPILVILAVGTWRQRRRLHAPPPPPMAAA